MIGIINEKDVPIPVRDGLKLAANVSRPDQPGKFPVIMAFTAFSKDGLWTPNSVGWGFADEPYSPTITGTAVFEAEDPAFWVRHEYVLVTIDPRGFNRSPGKMAKADTDGPVGEVAILRFGMWANDMYDAVEWAGTQQWSNGNVGLSGVSILAFSQWRTAALNPPHLKAFIPWEGMTDFYRDVLFRGGVPETEWGKLVAAQDQPVKEAWPPPEKENPPSPIEKEEDDFLADITVPALICGTWSNHGNHSRGAFRAFRKIASKQKWLYTHGRQEWAEFYNTEAQAIRKLFFDHFLKDMDNRILKMPPVRLETRENAEKYTIRYEADFPVPGTKYEKLYLDATDDGLRSNKNKQQSQASYDSGNGKATFDHLFEEDTELTGCMNLRLWVSPKEAQDMDLFVTLKKLGLDGKEVFFDSWMLPNKYPVALGWLRLSCRELDKTRSTPWEPYPLRVIGPGDKVKPGVVISCEIPVLPSSTLFRKGEKMRLIISGIFGGGELEGTHYGFNASVNKGTHIIYTGGKYDSYLLVPIVRQPEPA